MEPRIAVTGLGLVTPIGIGREDVWNGLLAGRSGFAPVESFDTRLFNVHLGAEVRGFEPGALRAQARSRGARPRLPARHRRRPARAGGRRHRSRAPWIPSGPGVAMGTTSGEPREVEKLDDRILAGELDRVGPEFLSLYPCHMIAAHVARELGFAGVNTMIPTACAAGNYALAHALDMLRAGRADLMLAGGADSFSRITYTGFARLGAIAPERCQPFDRNRKGMIPGEGAAVLVLEPLERALGPRRADLRRARRLRALLRRPPHDRRPPGGGRRRARDGAGARRRRRRARRGRATSAPTAPARRPTTGWRSSPSSGCSARRPRASR